MRGEKNSLFFQAPFSVKLNKDLCSGVAQSAAQRTVNPCVVGSSPTTGAIKIDPAYKGAGFLFYV